MDVPRSKLFVPADRVDAFGEALASGADAVCFDLEDTVDEAAKIPTRGTLAASLRDVSGTAVWLRVNGCGTSHLVADVLALAGVRVDVVNLPKVEQPAQLQLLDELLAHIERVGQLAHRIPVVATIETAAGLRRAADIGRASPRLAALQLGAGDLTRESGVPPQGPSRDLFRMLLVLAAAEAGVPALDSTPPGLDPRAFEDDARQARALGFRGKSCTHASQVAVANAVFSLHP